MSTFGQRRRTDQTHEEINKLTRARNIKPAMRF